MGAQDASPRAEPMVESTTSNAMELKPSNLGCKKGLGASEGGDPKHGSLLSQDCALEFKSSTLGCEKSFGASEGGNPKQVPAMGQDCDSDADFKMEECARVQMMKWMSQLCRDVYI